MDYENTFTADIQQKLEEFKNILQEGAISLAKNLLKEGETGIQFDDTDIITSHRVPLSEDDVKNMSFEDFAAHLAFNPPGGIPIDPFGNGRRGGTRIASISPLGRNKAAAAQFTSFQNLPIFSDEYDSGSPTVTSSDVQSDDVNEIIEKLEEADKEEICEQPKIDFQSSSDDGNSDKKEKKSKPKRKRTRRQRISKDDRKPYRSVSSTNTTKRKKRKLKSSKSETAVQN